MSFIYRSSNLPLELHSCNSVVENSSSETELSDTESVHQAMSLSSPEDSPHPEAEGDKNAVSKFVTDVERRPPLIVCNSQPTETSPPSQEEEDDDDEDSNSKDSGEKTDKRHSTSSDSSDCSDYVTSCSLRGPSRHDVRKAERLIIDLMSTPKHLARTPEESDEQYARRVRKHNYLSLAQEFAARNRGEKQTPVDEVPEICQTLPSSLRRGPSVTCGNIEDFKPVSQFTISEDSREWAKNMKNTAKCLTTSSQQHDNRRPVNFEVKDTSRPLLSVSSLINAPSSNQNAIHRHHQRSLAKYDACLAKDHDGSREHWTTQTHKFKPLNLKLSSGLTTDRNSESANKSKNSIYSDLPANVAKMVRNSLPPVSGSTSCKSNKATCETYLQRTASRTNCLSGLPTPHHHPENIHNAPSSHLSSHNNESNYKNTKVPSPPQEILGGFDVYNIETAMPTIDWAAMEEHLTKAAKEEVFFHKVSKVCKI